MYLGTKAEMDAKEDGYLSEHTSIDDGSVPVDLPKYGRELYSTLKCIDPILYKESAPALARPQMLCKST